MHFHPSPHCWLPPCPWPGPLWTPAFPPCTLPQPPQKPATGLVTLPNPRSLLLPDPPALLCPVQLGTCHGRALLFLNIFLKTIICCPGTSVVLIIQDFKMFTNFFQVRKPYLHFKPLKNKFQHLRSSHLSHLSNCRRFVLTKYLI